MRLLRSALSNDSAFGKIMTRCGIIIGANLMFILFCLPVVTIGGALAALYYTMLSVLRDEEEINPFRLFLHGWKENWKQGTIVWLGTLILAGVLALELFWCSQWEGVISYMQYPLLAIGMVLLILVLYIYPTMAAFRGTIPQLLKDSVFFAFRKPVNLLLSLFMVLAPVAITFADQRNLPLYAFLWSMFGFGGIAMFQSGLLVKLFEPYLDAKANEDDESQTEQQILDDMIKLGM